MSFDLLAQIGSSLDPHMLFTVIKFLRTAKVYDEKEVLAAEWRILSKTSLFNEQIEVLGLLGKNSDEIEKKRAEFKAEMDQVLAKGATYLSHFEAEERIGSKFTSWTAFVSSLGAVPATDVQTTVLKYARMLYAEGRYSQSARVLRNYRDLDSEAERTSKAESVCTASQWGELAAEIMAAVASKEAFAATKLIQRMTQDLETRGSFASQVEQRKWLMHWTVFLTSVHASVFREISESFILEKAMAVMQLSSPFLLRYLAVAAVIRRRWSALKEVVRMVQNDVEVYRDPIVDFVDALHVQFDYVKAEKKLVECEAVFKADFFLHNYWTEFFEAGHQSLLESICRLHQAFNMKTLEEDLHISKEEVERFIANRNAHSAEVAISPDGSKLTIVSAHTTVQSTLAEKVKSLTQRTAGFSSSNA